MTDESKIVIECDDDDGVQITALHGTGLDFLEWKGPHKVTQSRMIAQIIMTRCGDLVNLSVEDLQKMFIKNLEDKLNDPSNSIEPR